MEGSARTTDALRTLLGEFGDEVVDDPDRVRALLNDLLGSEARAHRLEIDALVRVAGDRQPEGPPGELDDWAREAWNEARGWVPAIAVPAEPIVARPFPPPPPSEVVDRPAAQPRTVPDPPTLFGPFPQAPPAARQAPPTGPPAPPPPQPSAQTGPAPEPWPPAPPPTRRRRAPLVVAAVLGVLALVVAVVLVAGRGGSAEAMPRLTGLSEQAARKQLTDLGVAADQITVRRKAASADDVGKVLSQSPAPDEDVDDSTDVALTIGATGFVDVAKVVGKPQSDATKALEEQGFEVKVVAHHASSKVKKGAVINQDPAAGTELAVGSTVKLSISLGAGTVAVPEVRLMLQPDAVEALKAKGFKVSQHAIEQTDTSPKAGTVVRVDPVPGTKVKKGSRVAIYISPGPTPGQTVPQGTTPKGTTPKGTTPKGTSPHNTTPQNTTPQNTTPQDTTPKNTTPVTSCHEDPSGNFICD
jgi:beta-lactam-binding protein with PASTA domain